MALELVDVSYRYPSVRGQSAPLALRGVSLRLELGRCVALVGSTGSGKSTVAQMVGALARPTGGRVLLDGREIWGVPRRARLFLQQRVHRQVGVVFQYPEHQFFEERVADEVAYGPRNFGVAADEVAARVRNALSEVGLDASLGERSPFHLSGGEMRRVALASVLVSAPRYLVLDEPSAGLDGGGRAELLRLLATLSHRGMGELLITHRMDEVGALADHVVVLHDGSVVAEGSPRDLFAASARLREWGLDVPPAAAILADLAEEGVSVRLGALTNQEAADAILARWRARPAG